MNRVPKTSRLFCPNRGMNPDSNNNAHESRSITGEINVAASLYYFCETSAHFFFMLFLFSSSFPLSLATTRVDFSYIEQSVGRSDGLPEAKMGWTAEAAGSASPSVRRSSVDIIPSCGAERFTPGRFNRRLSTLWHFVVVIVERRRRSVKISSHLSQ